MVRNSVATPARIPTSQAVRFEIRPCRLWVPPPAAYAGDAPATNSAAQTSVPAAARRTRWPARDRVGRVPARAHRVCWGVGLVVGVGSVVVVSSVGAPG